MQFIFILLIFFYIIIINFISTFSLFLIDNFDNLMSIIYKYTKRIILIFKNIK